MMTIYVRVGKARIALKPVNATCSSGVDKAHYMLARATQLKRMQSKVGISKSGKVHASVHGTE